MLGLKKYILLTLFLIKNKLDSNPFIFVSIFSQIIVFIISIFTWRFLGIKDFGFLSILEFYSIICASLFGISSEQLIVRDYFKWSARIRKYYIGNILLINWGSSIILFFIIAYLSYIFPIFSIPFNFIFLTLLASLLQSTSLVPFSIIRFRSNIKEYFVYMFFSSVFRAIISFIFVAIFNQGIFGLLIAQVYSGIVLLLGNVIYLLPITKFAIKKRIFKEVRKFSYPLIPSNILVNFSSVIFRLILGRYSTLEINGYFNIANKLSSPITSLHTALKITYVPSIVALDSENLEINKDKILNLSQKYFNVLFLISFIIILFLNEIIKFLSLTADIISIRTISFFIFISFLTTCQLYLSFGIFLSRKTKFQFLPNLFNIILLLIPGIFLIEKYDVTGVYFEEIARNLVSIFLAYFLSIKLYNLKPNFSYYSFFILFLLLISQIVPMLYYISCPYLVIGIKIILLISFLYLFKKKCV